MLGEIYEQEDLDERATCKDFLWFQQKGARRVQKIRKFYSLEAIIGLGSRMKVFRAPTRWEVP